MSRLAMLQAALGRALRSKAPIADEPAHRAFAKTEVRSGILGAGDAHLEVYREQFGLRHVGSLLEDFPAVTAMLGEESMKALLADYLEAHPPTHYSLLYAGHALGDFLAAREAGPATYFLADLAAFEYALVATSECADAEALSMEAVAAVPEEAWPTIGLVFHPTFRLHAFAFPVHEIRRAVDLGKPPSPGHEPAEAQTYLALARDAHRAPTYLAIDPDQFAALEALVGGAPLGQIQDERLAGWFEQWIAWTWVVGLRRP